MCKGISFSILGWESCLCCSSLRIPVLLPSLQHCRGCRVHVQHEALPTRHMAIPQKVPGDSCWGQWCLQLLWCCLHCVGPKVRYFSLFHAKLVSLWLLAQPPDLCPQVCSKCRPQLTFSWNSQVVMASDLWWQPPVECLGTRFSNKCVNLVWPCFLWDPALCGLGRLFGNAVWTFKLSNIKCYPACSEVTKMHIRLTQTFLLT